MLKELEVNKLIGEKTRERTSTRMHYRNGFWEWGWETRVGEINLRIPKLRFKTYIPSLLESCRYAEKALMVVIQKA